MEIKIITLFNKIANNEKVPKHIILNNVVFHYDDNVQDYENDFEYLFRDSFSNFDRSEDFLNLEVEEVEIIEEEKEIEKIHMIGDVITYNGYEWYIIEEKDDSFVLFMKERMNKVLIKELFTDTRMIDDDYDVRFSRDKKNNDWRDSYIRQVLNTKFLEKFIIDDLVLMKTKYDSDKESIDYIRLITIAEVEKLGLSIRKVNNEYGYWTMSPSDFCGYYAYVRRVRDDGFAGNVGVDVSYGVRPVIQVKKDVLGG